MKDLALLLVAVGIVLLATPMFIRSVQAEDDCAENTMIVERLPVVGLVCIIE